MLKKIMQCKQVIPWMASLFSIAITTQAEAATVQLDMMGNIISIEDIQLIEGGVQIPGNDFTFRVTSTYSINFLFGAFNDIFGDPSQPGFDTSCNVGSGNGLCFWQNEMQATMLVNEISDILNALDPPSSHVAGTPVGFPPGFPPELIQNVRNFYLVPVNFTSNSIRSRQGTNDDTNTWVTDPFTTNSTNSARVYASTELTSQEFKAEIPESSNLIGIVVTAGLMVLVTRKK